MQYKQTIALARSLLTEGRTSDVFQMIEGILPHLPEVKEASEEELALYLLATELYLLHLGDWQTARRFLESLAQLQPLPPSLQVEFELWQAWLLAWPDHSGHHPVQAIQRFKVLRQHTHISLRPELQTWVTLGLARSYATLDEYALLAETLFQEPPVVRYHRFLRRWYEALALPAWLYQGDVERARKSTEYLEHFGRSFRDPYALAEGLLTRIRMDQLLGEPPSQWLPLTEEAEEHLRLLLDPPSSLYTLLYRLKVEAAIQSGDFTRAGDLLQTWKGRLTTPSERKQYVLLESERLIRMEQAEEALALLLHDQPPAPEHASHYRLAIEHALQVSRAYAASGDYENAHQWALKACARSREIGSAYHVHRARLYEALTHHDPVLIQDLLTKVLRDLPLLRFLPLAEERHRVQAHLARVRKEDPVPHLEQARTIASLMEDPWLLFHNEVALARALVETYPSRARTLLDTARTRARQLGLSEQPLEEIYARLPRDMQGTPFHQVTIGRSLFRSAISHRLVAETWLQALEELLPQHWMAIFQYEKPDAWKQLRVHGPQPPAFRLPSPPFQAVQRVDNAYWMAVPSHNEQRTYLLGVEAPETTEAWASVFERIEPWLPVLALALDHANMYHDVRLFTPEPQLLPSDFVYASLVMDQLVRRVHRIAPSHSPVLIEGPTGTGKKHLARLLHTQSRRHASPFHVLHPEVATDGWELLHMLNESWTQAAEGTLVIAHVDRLPLRVQAHLLHRMEQSSSSGPRIVATTTVSLEERIARGLFHDDLFARLHTIRLRIPPLRERIEDIPPLAYHFLRTLHPFGMTIAGITEEALHALMQYAWPGNVRQLRNELERIVTASLTEPAIVVSLEDLSDVIRAAWKTPEPLLSPEQDKSLEEQVAAFEKQLIEETLSKVEGNVSAAARILGLTRQGLYKKMRRLDIQPLSSMAL